MTIASGGAVLAGALGSVVGAMAMSGMRRVTARAGALIADHVLNGLVVGARLPG